MAHIVGTITTSRRSAEPSPKGLQNDPYWKRFFDGFPPVRDWLASVRPDVAVVVYNDHGLNFFLDKMPTFAIGAAPVYRNADEGWGIPVVPPFQGDPALSWHLIDSLVAEEFDLVTCQEMTVDHAFTLPMALCWPDQKWPVRTVPVVVNTIQAPLPSAARCYKLGQALGRAIASWPTNDRVVVLGTGGLSHQLDGERAGFINKDFDLQFIDSLVRDRRGPPDIPPWNWSNSPGPGGGTAQLAGGARDTSGDRAPKAGELPHPGVKYRLRPAGTGTRLIPLHAGAETSGWWS